MRLKVVGPGIAELKKLESASLDSLSLQNNSVRPSITIGRAADCTDVGRSEANQLLKHCRRGGTAGLSTIVPYRNSNFFSKT